MTKEKEVLSNQAFHQWKQSDCTVALLKLIEDAIEIGDEEIIEEVKNRKEINIHRLNFLKGKLHSFYELQTAILNKEMLEEFVGGEDEVE